MYFCVCITWYAYGNYTDKVIRLFDAIAKRFALFVNVYL